MKIENFWSKVDISSDRECWLWKGTKNPDGYGLFRVDKIKVGAHRFSYELHKGKIPKGLQIDHLCRNRACVNPDHLEAVLPKINYLRGISPWAKNAKKTHCPKGHELSGNNLIKWNLKHGHRNCKKCHNEQAKHRRSA